MAAGPTGGPPGGSGSAQQHAMGAAAPPTSRLCVKNLPKYLDEAKLKAHFAAKGEVTDVKILRTKWVWFLLLRACSSGGAAALWRRARNPNRFANTTQHPIQKKKGGHVAPARLHRLRVAGGRGGGAQVFQQVVHRHRAPRRRGGLLVLLFCCVRVVCLC